MSRRSLAPVCALLLLATGFVPTADPIQVGPDAPHLDRDAQAQTLLNLSPAARAFRARWGQWTVRWDQRNNTPRSMLAPGVSSRWHTELVNDVAVLAGVQPSDLELVRTDGHGERESWHYRQLHQGAPIEGAFVDVHALNGRVQFVHVSLHRPRGLSAPEPGQVLAVLQDAQNLDYAWAHRVVTPDQVQFWSADGELLHAWTTRHHLEVRLEERTVGDPILDGPARSVWVEDSAGGEETASDGSHSRTDPYTATLDGTHLVVMRDGDVVHVDPVVNDLMIGGEHLSHSSAVVLHHTHVARDWVESVAPWHAWLPDQIQATVDISTSCCNAYYTSGTINFFVGGSGWQNLGRIADVVYHEYGHGVHHYAITGGTFAGDVSEGSADYLSATLNNDPELGIKARTNGGYIREIETDKVYPDDVQNQVHADGLIWGSFLWNLRTQWQDESGDAGVTQTDTLFVQALTYGPTLTDLYEAVLVADDDDGDLSNGVPHGCELVDLLDQHGLGPPPMGSFALEHEPLGPQGSDTLAYPVQFELLDLLPECPRDTLGTVQVWYGVDLADPGDPEGYVALDATQDTDGVWGVELPRQLPGAQVHYWLAWSNTDGSEALDTTGGDLEQSWSFWVGDREAVWCEGFEADAADWVLAPGEPLEEPDTEHHSEWEVGVSSQGHYNPDAPADGAAHLGTDLSVDGDYDRDNAQYALGPALPLSDTNQWMTLLTAQRWLTVEDAKYDRATVELIDAEGGERTQLWRNPRTSSGQEHLLDGAWTTHDLDLRPYTDSAAALQPAWVLTSDPGLEYGGWNLDQVCLVTLADVPRHYRVRDLVATDDGDAVTVTWTQPFMAPMDAAVLVRSDGPPSDHSGGSILELWLEPEPGASVQVVDDDVLPGEQFTYTVFVAQNSTVWFDDVVDAENSDVGGVPAEPEDTQDTQPDSPVDTDPVQDTDPPVEPDPACGCGSTGTAPVGLLAVLLLFVVRRARRSDHRALRPA